MRSISKHLRIHRIPFLEQTLWIFLAFNFNLFEIFFETFVGIIVPVLNCKAVWHPAKFFSWIYSSEGSILLFLCRVQCFSHFVYSKITINCLTQARISSKFYTNKVVLIFYIGLFHPVKMRSCFFQAISRVGRLTCVSYGHVSVSQELHRDNEISIKPVSPVKRASFFPYEQPLNKNKLGTSKKNNDVSEI